MSINSEVKTAFITGITGQDGYYLTEFLLKKGYIVHGMIRRSSSINTNRLDKFYKDRHDKSEIKLYLHYGDITDSSCLLNLIQKIKPDEVYHLAAMSHVKISFEVPEYAGEVDGLGTLKLLEAIRTYQNSLSPNEVGILKHPIKFYNAATSELYGGIYDKPQNENTPFNPKSPYAIAKLYGYWITKNYRESYNMFCCNGILFNHTSPFRGHNFVEQKIVKAAVRIYHGKQDCLYLGNLYSKRDIGHSKDYVKAMWLMLNSDSPDDYVISTGESFTIKEIVELVFNILYNKPILWEGSGINEIGKINISDSYKTVVKIDSEYFRPSEVDSLCGDSTKAKDKLGWKPEYTFFNILREMIDYEIKYNL